MTLFCGMDNGKHGGIAIINEKEEILMLVPMPVIEIGKAIDYDIKAISKIFCDLPDERVYVCLEKSFMLFRNGCKANYNIGWNMGAMEGVFSALEISYEIVAPQLWQKEIFQGISVVDTKEASIMFCKRKWPQVDLKVGNKESDGMSDSLCLSLYCFRHNGGQAK